MNKYQKRADGRYCVQIATGEKTAAGRSKVVSIYGRTISELENKIAMYRVSRMQAENREPTFREYTMTWYEAKAPAISVATQYMYQRLIENHISILADRKLSGITRTMIQQQVNTLTDKPNTAQKLLLLISQVYASAMMDRVIDFNPCDGIKLPRRVKKYTKRAFTPEEKIAIRTADYTVTERAFIMVLYCCGVRPAEAYALTWQDVDFGKRELNINKALSFDRERSIVAPPKTDGSIRTVPLPPLAMAALDALRASNSRLLLFGDESDHYMTKSRYNTLYVHCRRKINDVLGYATDITAYYFRHNYATELYYSGISIKEAIRLMGHADSSMLMEVYAHLDASRENTICKVNNIEF